jgi:hypothetical protein
MLSCPGMPAKLRPSGLLLAALLLCCAQSRAQDKRDPAAAEALFRQGRAASEQRDFLTACAKFRESNRLDPALGTLFNIADCEEKIGRFATSWTLFREVAQRLASDDDRQAIAIRRARALEPRVPLLLVHLAPSARAGVQVQRDGVLLGAASLDTPLPVDPGEHLVVVQAPGAEPAQFRAAVGEGEHAELKVSVGAARAQLPGQSDGPGRSGQRSAAFAMGGVGAAGLVVGVVAGLLVLERRATVNDQCHDHLCSQTGLAAARSGKTWGIVTTLGLATAALGLGGATYLFLTTPAPRENARLGEYSLGIRAKW